MNEGLQCPECSSIRLYKDGLRYLPRGASVQRWLCRKCGYRFSVRPLQENPNWSLNTPGPLASSSQICATFKDVKNLERQSEIKTVGAGEINQTQHGYIVEFQWKMKKRNKALSTIQNRTLYLTRLVKLGADLRNPETVETIFLH